MDRIDRSKDFDVVKYGRGTVWYVDFGIDDKTRPAIIMSVNRNYPEIAVIPLTTQNQQVLPWNIRISMPDGRESIAKCNCLQRINVKSISNFVGVVSDEVMHNLEFGVCSWLGIVIDDTDSKIKYGTTCYNTSTEDIDVVKNTSTDIDVVKSSVDFKKNKKDSSKVLIRRDKPYIRWTEELINDFLSDYNKREENPDSFLKKWDLDSLSTAAKTSYRLKKRLRELQSKSK